jgi:hypothetical protein
MNLYSYLKRSSCHLLKPTLVALLCLFIVLSGCPLVHSKWSDVEVISSESTGNAYRAIIGADSTGTVHVAWKDDSDILGAGTDWDVMYKSKPHMGQWTTTELVSTESSLSSHCLFLTVDYQDTVHVVWKDDADYLDSGTDSDVWYAQKPHNGAWSSPELVSTDSQTDCSCPCIAVDSSGKIVVVWTDGTNYLGSGDDWDVVVRWKEPGGMWSPIEVVSTESTHTCVKASVAIDNTGGLHILWIEEGGNYSGSGSDWDVMYKERKSNGSWSPTEVVSRDSSGDSLNPSFVMIDNENILHIAWVDDTDASDNGGTNNILYAYKRPFENWSSPEIVSFDSEGSCNWPYLCVDGNDTVYVTWSDNTNWDNAGNDFDIVCRKKPKGGEWTDVEVVSIGSMFDSHWPSCCVDHDGFFHVTWWDEESQWTTYYRVESPEKNTYPEESSGIGIGLMLCVLVFLIWWRKRQ